MICVWQSCWGEKHGSNSLPKLDPIPPFPVFSLELTVPNTFAPPIPLTYRPMSQTHDPLCIWLLLIFICCPHAKMSRTQSARPQLLTGLEETRPQGCVLCRDTQLCPKYGKEGVKTCYYATSYQPFDNSQGNQEERGQPDCDTASPSSPSWQDPGHRDCARTRGRGKSQSERKQPPNCYFHRV